MSTESQLTSVSSKVQKLKEKLDKFVAMEQQLTEKHEQVQWYRYSGIMVQVQWYNGTGTVVQVHCTVV